MFAGASYAQDGGKYWEVVPNAREYGSMTIEKAANGQFRVQLHFMEDKSEKYPASCGEMLKACEGKEAGNELVLYRKGQERFRIVRDGEF